MLAWRGQLIALLLALRGLLLFLLLRVLVGVLAQDHAARYGDTGGDLDVEALAVLVRPG